VQARIDHIIFHYGALTCGILSPTLNLDRRSLDLKERVSRTPQWAAAVEAADRLLSTVRPRSVKDGRKFLRLDAWLPAIISRTSILDLQSCDPLTILDLGTGTGLFPFVCQNLGHTATGLDLPGDLMRSPEREIFTQMPEIFGVTVSGFPIRAFTSIEGIGSYDLITAFLVNFNNHKRSDEWSRGEWEYLIADLRTHLNPGGRIALMLNTNVPRYGEDLQYYDENTRSFLASVGRVYGAAVLVGSTSGAGSSASSSREEAYVWQRQRTMEALIGGGILR
jgi:SAM-dependent methyltransferase